MISLCLILAGGVFTYVGIKKRFFVMWAMIINLLVSMFLSVMLMPLMAKLVPDIGRNAYFLTACLLVLSALFYVLFHMIVKLYITGNNPIEFPLVFDRIGSGVLGFFFGYFACSFVLFALSVMPIAKHEFITNVFGEKGLGPVVSRPVKIACNFVGSMTIQCHPNNCEGVIDWLGAVSEKQEEPELESIRTEIEEELKENN
jgi:hypothetical protein